MKKVSIVIIILALCIIAIAITACSKLKSSGKPSVTSAKITTAGSNETSSETTSEDTSANTTDSVSNEPVITNAEITTASDTAVTTATPVTTVKEPSVIKVPNSDVYNGSLILVNGAQPYCYRITALNTPSEMDRLSSQTLSEQGWASLYINKTGKYLLRSRMLFMKREAYEAFNSMMQAYVSHSGNIDVQVRYTYQMVSGTKDAASLADERITGYVAEVNVLTDEGAFSIEHASKKKQYYDWFASNCHKYGFIMNGESGYFRYVGIPHATYIHRNAISLASYLENLKSSDFETPVTLSDDNGVMWKIYYCRASDISETTIKVPDGCECNISGNNSDGFIISARVAQGK